jgi:hypothetical protein
MTEYYDIVLGVIPVSLVGITGFLFGVAGLSLTVAVPLGAVVSVGIIGHAMFVKGPVDAVRNPPRPMTEQLGEVEREMEQAGTDVDGVSDSQSVAAK